MSALVGLLCPSLEVRDVRMEGGTRFELSLVGIGKGGFCPSGKLGLLERVY